MVAPVTVTPKPTIRRGGIRKSKRTSIRSISPNLVYDFALRCAIRAHLEQTETKPAETNNISDVSPSGSLSKKERHLSFQSSFSSFTDKFSDEKTDKLTREFVKGLTQRLQDVYKGKDTSKPEYNDPRFRTVAKIVKKSLQEHKFRPTGTINDTVILFLKTSEAELKNSQPAQPSWYEDLNPFMARFAEMVIQTIQEDASSCGTPELMEKLNGFCAPPKKPNQIEKRSSNSSNLSTNSTLDSLLEFPMVVTIKQLFKMDDKDHRQKLAELIPICTESALLHDLKKCINNVHTNQAFPGRKEDFATLQAYDHWQKKELKQLTELMKSLMLMNPNLSIASSSEVDVGNTNLLARQSSIDSYTSVSSQNSNHSSTSNDSSAFTFIPSDPKNYFRFLMSLCLDHDTEDLASVPESERAKTSALSQQSDQLLRECWRTWRLSAPFRAILYLSLVKTKFDQNELGIEDLQDALRSLDRVTKENELSSWSIADRGNVGRALDGIQSSLMNELAKGLSEYSKISPIWVQDIIDLLEKLYSNPIFAEAHPLPQDELIHLEDVIKGAAIERWRDIEKSINHPENDDLTNLFDMSDKLNKELSGLAKKKFPEPIMGVLSVPSLVMARQMPYFALEMENWTFSPEFKTCPVDSAFALYEKVLNLEKLYDEFGPETKKSLFKVESWFLSHVKRWLTKTNEATLEWVQNAVAQDKFERFSDVVVHSSSVIDLFTMFNQAVDFISDLQWPNDVQHCLFQTFMAKIIAQGIEHYCRTMNDLIRKDVLAVSRPSSHSQEVEAADPSILDKARYQIMGNRGLEASCQPMNCISPELCVKLNNFEAARAKLDRLYRSMNVDEIAQFMRQNQTQNTPKVTQNKFLYTIRVVRAENLQPMDKNGLSDPYVVFEIDNKLITRTHTVYETLNPRWDQEFDIWLSDSAVDVCVMVNDEDMLSADEECGVAWFTLSPRFNDVYQKDDLVLSLSPQGSLVLRITMESEKNDIQFWFGKAFRTLKTSEKDTAGLIIDQIAPFLRHCLSRQVLDKMLGKDKSSGFFSAFSRVTSKQTEPDLQACEDAIAPLLDFLEYNLSILNNDLSETNMKFIVLSIWDQILKTLEGIMLPPLSEQLSDVKPLDDYELRIVLKWLELLKILFNGGEDADAIPLDYLENDHYYSLLAINAAYSLETQVLMDGYYYRTKRSNSSASLSINRKPTNRSKTVYHSKNTIRHKKPKAPERRQSILVDMPHADSILRILRMRKDRQVAEFLRQEFEKRNYPSSQVEDDVDSLLIKKTSSRESSSSLKRSASPSGVTLTD